MMKIRFLAFLMALAGVAAAVPAGAQLLGKISFPSSGAVSAQADFLEGVLFLHNFEYADAARAFRRAQDKDAGFALAYWGEAMTHNHPLWRQQDRRAAVAVLDRLAPTPGERAAKAGNDRERGYLDAVERLYGTVSSTKGLSKEDRDDAYAAAMRRHSERYPEDHEAATFYALSILGTAHEGRDFATYMRAAAEAQRVWDANREHPGAAHYLIHSFDDPVHAPLGLPMAKAYSKIAPAAAHAQHMTSHIFVAMGMWDEVATANEIARDVQNRRQTELNEPPSSCGHYSYWLFYGYLQQGRVSKAAEVLDTCEARVRDGDDEGELWHFRAMRARYVIDAEDWGAVDRWSEPPGSPDPPTGEGGDLALFAEAYAAWRRGDLSPARRAFEALHAYEPADWPPDSKDLVAIARLELAAIFALEDGEPERAIELLGEAITAEAALPYAFGPPQLAKPASELLGEVLSRRGRWQQARDAFSAQLARTPDRTTALSGLAEAARHSGDETAAEEVEARLAAIREQADAVGGGAGE